MKEPWDWSEEDLLELIRNRETESFRLEFKACGALDKSPLCRINLSKDVSAFANAAGGTLIYGIVEDKKTHEAKSIDEGYDPSFITKDWIEQVIHSTIERRIEGISLNRISLDLSQPGRVAYVIYVPKSNRAPHMAKDNRFYKRFETRCVRMEEYEVRESYRRETYPSREIVCAWRDAVINPLIDFLQHEEDLIKRTTGTWDRRSLTFSQFDNLSDPGTISANREQFLEKYEHLTTEFMIHDQMLTQLNKTCRVFFDELKKSSWFIDRFDTATTAEALNELKIEFPRLRSRQTTDEILYELFGRSNHEECLAIVAEYTVNHENKLPGDDRTTAPFWNKNRASFLQLVSPYSPLAESWQIVIDAKQEFFGVVVKLKESLKAIRSELSIQHGIPVEAPMSWSKSDYPRYEL